MSAADNVVIMEHLTLQSPLSLKAFCARFRSVLHLPEFHFDAENETEWGFTEVDDVEFNVSRPYEAEALRAWDDTVPLGCNFGITLSLQRTHKSPTHEWAVDYLVTPVARTLAKAFSTPVYFHRAWLGPGQTVAQHIHFLPDAA